MIASSDPNPTAIFSLSPNFLRFIRIILCTAYQRSGPCNGIHADASAFAVSPTSYRPTAHTLDSRKGHFASVSKFVIPTGGSEVRHPDRRRRNGGGRPHFAPMGLHPESTPATFLFSRSRSGIIGVALAVPGPS